MKKARKQANLTVALLFANVQEDLNAGKFEVIIEIPFDSNYKATMSRIAQFKRRVKERSDKGDVTFDEIALYEAIVPYDFKTINGGAEALMVRRFTKREEDDLEFAAIYGKDVKVVARQRTMMANAIRLMEDACQIGGDVEIEVPDDYELPTMDNITSVDKLF